MFFNNMTTKHLIIKGKVQGVFYRASAKKKAEELRVCGWVKNTKEGHVEALVSGETDQVDQFIEWCYKGPSDAEVDSVIVEDVENQSLHSFSIIR
jgi:acylphosphatase